MFKFFEAFIDPYKYENCPNNQKMLRTISAFILMHVKGVKRYLFMAGVLIGLSSAMEVYIFSFIGNLVDSLRVSSPQDFLEAKASALFYFSVLLLIILPIINVFNSLINHQVLTGSFSAKLIYEIHSFLLNGKIGFFRDRQSGRIASDLFQTAQSVRGLLIKVMDVFIYVGVFWVGTTIYMANTNLLLLFPIYIWLICYAAIIFKFVPTLKILAAEQTSSRSRLMGFVVDVYKNIKTIKIYLNRRYELASSIGQINHYLSAVNKQMRFVSKIIFSLWAINVLLIFSVMILAIYLWSVNHVSVGEVSAAVALTLKIYSMSHWIMWETSALSENIGAVKNGMSMYDVAAGDLSTDNNPRYINNTEVESAVTLKDVTFGYPNNKNILLKFSLEIGKGEAVGIVGRSGCGKSTLINLILGINSPQAGKVWVLGRPVEASLQPSILESLAYVSQDVELFNRSIYENIIYGNTSATAAAVTEAAKLVEAHDFIRLLSDNEGNTGYQAKIDAASQNLSGGQKQRIALARAILKNSPILILDEATSALDVETELAVLKNVLGHVRRKQGVLIVISHRLVSLELLDKVMFLENGQLVEQGHHVDLYKLNGRYRDMYSKSVAL